MNTIKQEKVCVFGLGFVGLTLSIILAERGYKVVGLETNSEVYKALKKKTPLIYEKNINKRFSKLIESKKIILSKKLNKKLLSNIYIITVGTPLTIKKKCNLGMIKEVATEISNYLRPDDHVILRSTVKIGTTRNIVRPILMKARCKFYLSYCPERTVEGNAFQELVTLPQIVSGYDNMSSNRAALFFRKITTKIIKVKKIESAEMIKLVDNMQRDVQFALSNEVALMCDKSKINVNDVIRLGKINYPRTNLFDPGLVGGPCLEKDTYILSQSYSGKYKPKIALASRRLNESIPKYSMNLIKNFFKESLLKKKITICGLAFKGKPETNDMRGSTVYPIINEIKKIKKVKIYGFDNLVDDKFFRFLKIKRIKNVSEIFNRSSLVLIHNNHVKFSKLNINKLSKLMKKPGLIYDFWNNYSQSKIKLPTGIKYMALGNS